MSRLVDRILTNWRGFDLDILEPPPSDQDLARRALDARKIEYSEQEFDWWVQKLKNERESFKPRPVETDYDERELEGIPVIVGDEVGLYACDLPSGVDFSDLKVSMAPPFSRFFVEFQRVPVQVSTSLHAWGVYFSTVDDLSTVTDSEFPGSAWNTEDNDWPTWVVRAGLFIERTKGYPIGPIGFSTMGLAEDGTWFVDKAGIPLWSTGIVELTKRPPEKWVQRWNANLAILMFPALLAISLMHCTNVEIRQVEPPEAVRRKHRKKHGKDLVRYHVLDIGSYASRYPANAATTRPEWRRSLHLQRGHFKTFTEDAKLFGRHKGTFWWSPQARGSKDAGIVVKDYRVLTTQDFGRMFRAVSEKPPTASQTAGPDDDYDAMGVGVVRHNKTLNALARQIRDVGLVPLEPAVGDPKFDLAWRSGETLYVCEVKSVSPETEERQLRLAMGQVIRYRQKMRSMGHESTRAVIACEAQPADGTWIELCEDEGIELIWPSSWQSWLLQLENPAT